MSRGRPSVLHGDTHVHIPPVVDQRSYTGAHTPTCTVPVYPVYTSRIMSSKCVKNLGGSTQRRVSEGDW